MDSRVGVMVRVRVGCAAAVVARAVVVALFNGY